MANLNVMDYVTILTAGNATDFGDLTAARSAAPTACSIVRGITFAGNGADNTIDYITIASTGNATDFGDHNDDNAAATGDVNSAVTIHNKIYAYYQRRNPGFGEKHTIATAANASDFDWLSTAGFGTGKTFCVLKGWIAASG